VPEVLLGDVCEGGASQDADEEASRRTYAKRPYSAAVDRIVDATAEFFSCRPCDIRATGRSKSLIRARFIAMALVRERLDMSYPEIAFEFGGRDHTSIINGVRRARLYRMSNPAWSDAFDAVERSLLDWREESEIEKLEFGA
jgi:chromosomal replication initiation ATPase DnaA